MKKRLSIILCAILASTIVFAGCANNSGSSDSGSKSTTNSASSAATGEVKTTLDKIDMTKWQYNADDKVYYQIGISLLFQSCR